MRGPSERDANAPAGERTREMPNAQTRAILEGIPERCTILARDLTVLYQNRHAREAARTEGKALVGERWDPAVHGRAGARLAEEIARAFESGTGAVFEEEDHPAGSWSEFHLHVVDHGVVIYARDVTPRKRAEAELRSAQAALARSEKLSALGQLVSGVAHELRTPLTFLSTNAFLLKRRLQEAARGGRLDPGVHELADKHLIEIGAGVDRINQLIEDLRRYTNLRRGGEMRTGSLDGPIREAVELFHATDRAGHHVEATLRPTRPVRMDPGALQQVALNLLQNAAEAMPRGGTIRVRCRDEGGDVVLEVQDAGHGIPDDVQKRMFEPLYTTKTSGMGLGLSIVRRIADEHNAELSYETAIDRGTTFRIRFPPAA